MNQPAPSIGDSRGGGDHEGMVAIADVGTRWLDVEIAAGAGVTQLRFPVEIRGSI